MTEAPDGCWLWHKVDGNGYGKPFQSDSQERLAAASLGPHIPPG